MIRLLVTYYFTFSHYIIIEKTADLKCQRSTAFIETSFLNVSLLRAYKRGYCENDQSN